MARLILIHCAWGQAKIWGQVPDLLRAAGHSVEVPDLPGHGTSPVAPQDVGLNDYAKAIIQQIGNGPPAILIGHSLGGMAISAAAEAAPDAVAHLIYVAGFLPSDGNSLISLKKREGETIAPMVLKGPAPGSTQLDLKMAAGFLFQNAPPDQARAALALLGPQSNRAQTDPLRVTDRGLGACSKSYVVCTQDRTIGPDLQRTMAQEAGDVHIAELKADHTPQISAPQALSAVLLALIDRHLAHVR